MQTESKPIRKSQEPAIALDIPASLPIATKVDRLQKFLGNHYFHPNGMMYCMWHYKDGLARPFNEETDLGEFRYEFVNRENVTHKGWLDAENSPSTSGLFLWSQALRYLATGEEEAIEFARKAFASLETIFEISGKHDKPGLFGKPWGWKASNGTSPDQYICIMHGLWAFRKIASHQERKRIDRMLPLMADWWRTRNYTLIYFKIEWPILPHHAPAMACLHDMAYRVTGDRTYLDECQRLLTIAEGWPTWIDRNRQEMIHPKGFPVENNGVRWPKNYEGMEYDPARQPYLLHMVEVGEIWLTGACADYFMREGSALTPILRHAISRHYRYSQFGLREDLLTLMTIQVDLERDTWHPIPKSSIKEMCWGDFASRVPDLALIGHLHAPDYCPGALLLAKRMLERLDNERLHWYVDPDGQQVPSDRRWTLDLLSSDVPSFTCLAYWRARLAGIDLDAPLPTPARRV
jgi:hypothetical protein